MNVAALLVNVSLVNRVCGGGGVAGACEANYPCYTVVLSSVCLFFHGHILEVLPAVLAYIKYMAYFVISMYLI